MSEGEPSEEALGNLREAIAFYLEPFEGDMVAEPGAEILELVV